jgi:zeaxanthin glucosyltransferase
MSKTRIVIAGGGFAGLYAAKHFDKGLARRPGVEVTLISRENFILFTPMLHEVAAGDLHPGDIVNPWPHENTSKALIRNRNGVRAAGEMFAPIATLARSYAEKVGLRIDWDDVSATASKLAVISQTPREFDFPGIPWPAQFHYAGPLHDNNGREPIPFPWEKLNGNPFVYASMGTLVNGREHIYRTILQAVGQLSDIQVVLSLGKNVGSEALGNVPSNVIVVPTAPQIELLKRAALCITHAGLNTALESLAQGVPMVAIPIGYDQPGVAARIAYHGVGELTDFEDLTVERLRDLIDQVLTNPKYREKALWFQKIIAHTRGLDLAADVIERAFKCRPKDSYRHTRLRAPLINGPMLRASGRMV